MKNNKIIFVGIGLSITMGCYYAYQYKNAEMPVQAVATEKIMSADGQKTPKMHKYRLNKLWRDTAVERLEKEDGAIIHRIILDDEQYDKQLGLKLVEEANEVAVAKDKEELISEIGDVLDVLDCIIKLHSFSQEEISAARAQKIKERGGSYYNREFVTIVEAVDGGFLHKYYLKSPDRHPEIFD